MIEEDYIVDEDTILKPDVAVVCNEDIYSFIKNTPKLIVEVISPSTIKRDEKIKFKIYEEEGVKYYLLAYPEDKKIKIYQNIDHKFIKQGDFRDNSFKFETHECEFEVNFKEVFERL